MIIDVVNDVEGKILQIIQCSYPKAIMKKMRNFSYSFLAHLSRRLTGELIG